MKYFLKNNKLNDYRSFVLKIALCLTIMLGLFFSLKNVVPHASADYYNDFPRAGTSPNIGSNEAAQGVSGGLSNHAVATVGNTGNNFLLYDKNGNTISSGGGAPATRSEGLYSFYADFTIVAPTSVVSSQAYIQVTIKDGCTLIGDNMGWEDLGYKPGNNPVQDVSVQALNSNGNDYGGTEGGVFTTPKNCTNNNNNGDLTLFLDKRDFITDSRYGKNIESAIIEVDKANVGEKLFYVDSEPGTVATLVSTSPASGTASDGSTYNGSSPSQGQYNAVSIQDPTADYTYNLPGPCGVGSNSGNCSPYGNLNRDKGPASTYDFYFEPDCSYQSYLNDTAASNQHVYLKWLRGQGTSTTQDSNESWTLYRINSNGTRSQVDYHNTATDGQGYTNKDIAGDISTGNEYVWEWTGVDRAHGLTLWLPFGEFTGLGSFDSSSCPKPSSQCSWIGAADADSSRTGSNYPNSGGGSGGSYDASSSSVWISMNFNNNGGNGGTTWQSNNYGIHFLAPGGGGSTNPLFNAVDPGGSYTIYGSNHTNTLQFNQPANAVATVYNFQMTDGGGNTFGAKCSITIKWPPPNNKAIVQGHVYNLDPNGTQENMPGVTVADCNGQTTTTLDNGYFYFLEDKGSHFGLYIGACNATAAPPAGNNGPFIRPWTDGGANEGYFGCGPFGGDYSSPTPNYCDVNTSFKAFHSYDWQWAGTYIAPGTNKDCNTGAQTSSNTGCDSLDRSWDQGYDFVYTPQAPHGLVAADCANGIGGGVVNPPSSGNPLTLSMSYKQASQTNDFSNASFVSVGGLPQTDGNGNFNIPTAPYQNGYEYLFVVNADGLDMFGKSDGLKAGFGLGGNGPNGVGSIMSACAPFTTSGSTKVTLAPKNEAPKSYSTNSTATVTYDSGTNPSFNPNFAMSCDVKLSPNPIPNPDYDCSGGGFYSGDKPDPNYVPKSTPIRGPNGNLTSATYGDSYCPTLTLGYTRALVQEDGTIRSNYGQGQNVISDPNSCQYVENEPYVQFYGSDVTAGAGFNPSPGQACTQYDGSNGTKKGNISTFNNDGSSDYSGSGSQFGAFALDVIKGFASSINQRPPVGLSFANSGVTGQYGGSFGQGGSDYCIENYWVDRPSTTTTIGGTIDSGSTVNSAAGPNAYSVNGPLTINGLNIANKVNSAIYVNGDVTINGDIKYAGANGGWYGIGDIPSLFIVTSPGHNIHIAPGVKQLDGVYVAEPDAGNQYNNGVIDTCDDSSTNFGNSGSDSALTTCGNQLVVNGSFVARKINLHRTLSSLRYAQTGETLSSPARDCGTKLPDGVTEAQYGDCAAEIFNFSPELYMSLPGISASGGPAKQTFDAYDSLSPIL